MYPTANDSVTRDLLWTPKDFEGVTGWGWCESRCEVAIPLLEVFSTQILMLISNMLSVLTLWQTWQWWMSKYERKIAKNRTFLVFGIFCTVKFVSKKVPTQFNREDSWLSNGIYRAMREFGFRKLWSEDSQLQNSNSEGLASKKKD